MKSSDKLPIISFLYALSQQNTSLPVEAINSIQAIAGNLEERVWELEDLAKSLPQLEQPYRRARSYLVLQEGARGMGLDCIPNIEDGNQLSSQEKDNMSRDISKIVAATDADLERIRAALVSPNQTEAIQRTIFSP